VFALAGLLGFFLIIEDELEKLSIVCPSSWTTGMVGNGAIRTVDKSIKHLNGEVYAQRTTD
jgi:hypothetical protein